MANDIRTERTPKAFDSSKRVGDPVDYMPRIGEVMDNVDPGHMGKVWVYIEAKGRDKTNRDNWKMVSYCSPFYGTTNLENNSKGLEFKNTQQTYGMWMNPPDVGTMVLIIFVDGNPDNAWVIGYIPDAYMTHMIPGIAASEFWDSGIVNEKTLKLFKGQQLPVAEYNKKENNIESSFKRTKKPVHMPQFEMLREQGLIQDDQRGLTSSSAQRETPSRVFGISTPGRPLDQRAEKDPVKENYAKILKTPEKVKNSDIKIWNRQGGHSFVMDDGDAVGNNQLFRLRSASGHQILLNDTNDFIYIANSKGTAWIEINKDGGIDIFATDSISMHTDKNFNFDCAGDINMNIGNSLNIKTGTDIKFQTPDMNLNISNDYNRKVIGITTETYGVMKRTHIGGDTWSTNTAGIDYSAVCPPRTGAVRGCDTPSDPAAPPLYTTQSILQQPATEILKTGLKWSEGIAGENKTITTIAPRVPQHEPWNKLDNEDPPVDD